MTPDGFLEKHVLPHMEDWNKSFDQSHLQHTLIIGVFGLWSWVCWRFGLGGDWDTRGIATGLIAGVLSYAYREYSRRVFKVGDVNWWDGHMDWLVPAWVWGPWSLDQFGFHHTATAWMVASSVLVFLGYSFWRPKGKFLYNK